MVSTIFLLLVIAAAIFAVGRKALQVDAQNASPRAAVADSSLDTPNVASSKLWVLGYSLVWSSAAFCVGGALLFILGGAGERVDLFLGAWFTLAIWKLFGPILCFIVMPIVYAAALRLPHRVKPFGIPVVISFGMTIWPFGPALLNPKSWGVELVELLVIYPAIVLCWLVYALGMDKARAPPQKIL
jgi:hypothetical protein